MISDTTIGALILAFIALMIFQYLFTAFAYMTIARKLKSDKGWLAWIPYAGFFLFPILADWHWAWGFMQFAPGANAVFFHIWNWKIFEKRKYPGWFTLIPIGLLFLLLPLSVITIGAPQIAIIIMPLAILIPLIVMDIILGMVAWKAKKKR